nr:unnamed protein product [Callosobruchus chinensis]
MATTRNSAYFEQLVAEYPDVAGRYLQKISILGLDPFSVDPNTVSYDPSDFPPVTNMDLLTYLVLSTSYYTKAQMKAYKSLNAYKFFEAGFVTGCGMMKIKNYHVLLAMVKHSQRMTEPPLQTWVIVNEDGSIECAHCTCMAGTGEVCSHIGAVLYAAEFVTTSRNTTSCTDVRSLWNVPTMSQIRCEPLKEINFGRIEATSSSSAVPAASHADLVELLQSLKDANTSSVLMRLVEPFASEIQLPTNGVQNPYKHLYNEEYEILYLEQLLQLSDQYTQISISEDDCHKIEELTREQAASNEWFNQRSGRITASKLKQVCRTSLEKPSLSLIKQICYPLKFSFKTKETEWGLRHEPIALESYQTDSANYHQDLVIKKVGLVIQPTWPQLGASPDALVSCSCCGNGCVEIKCPYLLKTLSLQEYAARKTTCLQLINNEVCLDKTHSYYFQVQQQMAITQMKYCDFVVWSTGGTFVERVIFNEDFWLYHREIALKFHKRVIMPELLGRLFTCSTPSISTWCSCNDPDDGRPMICCDNELCSISWYHLDCVGLCEVPNDIWACRDCIK